MFLLLEVMRMYRPTDAQRSLFEVGMLMTQNKRQACEKSWAGPFREKVLPLLLKHETDFAELFDEGNGRPNKSVALVVGTLLLKEMNDLTDEETVGALDFDSRWWYAFELETTEAHVCQKTLHNFRVGLMEHNKAQMVFRGLTDELLPLLGIDVSRQRLDSTHILSNVARLTRLGVFCETIRVFLNALKKQHPERYAGLPAGILQRHAAGSDYADARHKEGPRRLGVVARDTYRLVNHFKGQSGIETMDEYGLLKRLLSERCDIVSESQTPDVDDDDSGEAAVPVQVKDAKEVASDSLQTPHDAQVTYSGHKGQGYEVQIAETCVANNPVELITHVEVTPSAKSDFSATVPVIEALKQADIAPKEMVADTNYSGAKNAAKAAEHEVNLLAPCPAQGKPDPEKTYAAPDEKCPTTVKGAGDWLRCQEAQKDFNERYAIRSGIEGTNSELKRAQGLGRLRVRGGERVNLVVHLKAASCNLKRALRYWLILPAPTIA
jgi:hypothetical protein